LAVVPDHLVKFLVRHCRITTLHLDRTLHDFRQEVLRQETFLPELTALEVDTDGLLRLMQLGHFSKPIQKIEILYRAEAGHPFPLSYLCSKLSSLAPLLVFLGLTIKITPAPASLDWLNADSAEHRCHSPQGCLLEVVTKIAFTSVCVYATRPPSWLSNILNLRHVSFSGCTDPDVDVQEFMDPIITKCSRVETIDIADKSYRVVET